MGRTIKGTKLRFQNLGHFETLWDMDEGKCHSEWCEESRTRAHWVNAILNGIKDAQL